MKINLSYNQCEMEHDIANLFNEIAYKYRNEFNELISKISDPINNNLDWWVSNPASRNTVASSFYHYYCILYLIRELIKKKNITVIIVDSKALKKILSLYFKKNNLKIKIRLDKNHSRIKLKLILNQFYFILSRLIQYFYVKKTKSIKKTLLKDKLTLIDTFVIPNYISKDRYYNGLWDNLSENERKKTYFVPTLSNFRINKIKSTIIELRSSKRNFLIKDDFLTLNDLLVGLCYCFRVRFLKVNVTKILGIDISRLIKEELSNMSGLSGSVEALLNYRFFKRIKQSHIELNLVVDWWENQALDKGWNAGINKYYPMVNSIGYLGYVPRLLELQLYPTEKEYSLGILPKIIANIGDGFVKETKMFCKKLEVISAPAFRFQHLWNNSSSKEDDEETKFNIVVALPLFLTESKNILKNMKYVANNFKGDKIKYLVKLHPTTSEEKLKTIFVDVWTKEFNLTDCIPNELLRIADVLISGTSSIALEAIALGVPTVIIETSTGFVYNPIPTQIPTNIYYNCKSSKESLEIIKKLYEERSMKKNEYSLIGKRIRKEYFMELTESSIKDFLFLS